MNSNSKILLNTTLGVILAVCLVTGLSSLNSFTASQNNNQVMPVNEDQELKLGEADERAPVMEASPPVDQSLEMAEESVVVTLDPMSIGTPFAVALVAGLAVFTLVRRKIQQNDFIK